MEPTEQLAVILATLSATVDRIQTMQMHNPTPYSDFNVHEVINHMIVLGGTFTYWFRGEEAPELKPPAVYGWVPKTEFRDVMNGLLEAVNSPGSMERTMSTPMGEMPGLTFARLVAFDGLIRGWDLASATGQTFAVPADVIASVDEFARNALTPAMRDGDTFNEGIVAPADSGTFERLVAFSGRSL